MSFIPSSRIRAKLKKSPVSPAWKRPRNTAPPVWSRWKKTLRRQFSAISPSLVGPYSTSSVCVCPPSLRQRKARPSCTGCRVSMTMAARAIGRPASSAYRQKPASSAVSLLPARPASVSHVRSSENLAVSMRGTPPLLETPKRGILTADAPATGGYRQGGMAMKVTGRCHCGQIGFEAEIDPTHVRICHFTDCQTLTGTAFRTNVASLPGTFVLTSGTPKIYIKTAESGNKRAHAFCPECGTPIYAAAPGANPTFYGLRVGALDRRAELRPTRQGWVRSALPLPMDPPG